MKALLLVLIALALASVTISQTPPATGLAGRQYIYCPCSPTTRGYRVDVLEAIQEHIEEVVALRKEEIAEKAPEDEINRELALKSQELWANCVNDYSMEECVNADTALRADRKCAPNCASFCEYDRGSWRNNANGAYGPQCDTVPKYKAKVEQINNRTTAEPGDVSNTPRNPSPGAEKPLSGKVPTRPQQANGRPAGGSSSIPAAKGEPTVNESEPVNAEEVAKPSKPIAPGTSENTKPSDTVSNANETSGTSPVNESDGGLEGVPLETLTPITNENSPPLATNLNEGCVAVEHLEGYTLQHSDHLERSVLCAKGFCATPNHALIVDGKWTSMSILCKEWDCVSTVKLVNNLKVAVNRRAKHGEFIITPYDMRFPRWCIWTVQIGADVLHLIGIACVLSVVTAFFILVGCAVKEL